MFSKRAWICFSGALWLCIGTLLLTKGLGLLSLPLTLVSVAVGLIKGRMVLSKTVAKMVKRIAALPLPIRMRDVYPVQYYLLIGGMMGLGFVLKWMPLLPFVRGIIDVTVGTALIYGSILYFKQVTYDTQTP